MVEKTGFNRLPGFSPYYRMAFLFFILFAIPITIDSQDYRFRHFNSGNGLPQPFIYSISQDSKGYLWIGTGSGLARFNGFEFENFTTLDSLADDFISCAISVGDQMWFGHMNGKLTHYNGKEFKPVNLPGNIQSPVTGMTKDHEGTLWISTYSDGVLKLKNETTIELYPFEEQLPVKCIGHIKSNELLLGTSNGLLHCRIINNKTVVDPIPDIPGSRISSIKKAANNGFLVATEEDGIFQVIRGS
jgi:ligand-binding sensor domain-containing protein